MFEFDLKKLQKKTLPKRFKLEGLMQKVTNNTKCITKDKRKTNFHILNVPKRAQPLLS